MKTKVLVLKIKVLFILSDRSQICSFQYPIGSFSAWYRVLSGMHLLFFLFSTYSRHRVSVSAHSALRIFRPYICACFLIVFWCLHKFVFLLVIAHKKILLPCTNKNTLHKISKKNGRFNSVVLYTYYFYQSC